MEKEATSLNLSSRKLRSITKKLSSLSDRERKRERERGREEEKVIITGKYILSKKLKRITIDSHPEKEKKKRRKKKINSYCKLLYCQRNEKGSLGIYNLRKRRREEKA